MKPEQTKKRVKILVASIAGTGDPSAAELEKKYSEIRRQYEAASDTAKKFGRPGRSPEEIERLVQAERDKDAQIPRVSGFTAPFAFRKGEEVLIDAELAAKWEASGICQILEKAA